MHDPMDGGGRIASGTAIEEAKAEKWSLYLICRYPTPHSSTFSTKYGNKIIFVKCSLKKRTHPCVKYLVFYKRRLNTLNGDLFISVGAESLATSQVIFLIRHKIEPTHLVYNSNFVDILFQIKKQ